MTALALGVNGIAQGGRGSVGLFAMTLVARARFGLDVRVVVTIGTTRSVLLRVVVMAVGELAQFGMMTAGTRLLRQSLLVIRGKLGVKFRRVARAARQRGQTWIFTLVMARGALAAVFLNVLHVTRMSKNYIAALVVQPKTNWQLFRRGWRELATQGQECQHTADNSDGYVTFFQGSVLVLRFDATEDRMLSTSIHLEQIGQNWRCEPIEK